MVSAELKLIIDELSTQGKMIFHDATTEEKITTWFLKERISTLETLTQNLGKLSDIGTSTTHPDKLSYSPFPKYLLSSKTRETPPHIPVNLVWYYSLYGAHTSPILYMLTISEHFFKHGQVTLFTIKLHQ